MSCSDCQINKGLAWQYHQQLQEARREIAVLREQLGISPKEPMYVIEEKPRPFRGVYFIESGGFIKIGISKDVRMRLKNLQLQTLPARLGFIPIESDEAAFNRERELHKTI
jgi:hypothetical protein